MGPRLQFARRWQSALGTELCSRRKNFFVAGQVLSLCEDADNHWPGDWRPLGGAGGTTGVLATLLLVCTAATRGKDDPYRGAFPRTAGKFHFWWSEFWTEGSEARKIKLIIRCSEQMASEQQFRTLSIPNCSPVFRRILCPAASITSVFLTPCGTGVMTLGFRRACRAIYGGDFQANINSRFYGPRSATKC